MTLLFAYKRQYSSATSLSLWYQWCVCVRVCVCVCVRERERERGREKERAAIFSLAGATRCMIIGCSMVTLAHVFAPRCPVINISGSSIFYCFSHYSLCCILFVLIERIALFRHSPLLSSLTRYVGSFA